VLTQKIAIKNISPIKKSNALIIITAFLLHPLQ